MYTSLVRSILLYGAGTWTTTVNDLQMLETFEMSCIRSILKTSRIHHFRSVDLKSRLGIDTSIVEEVRRARLRQFGHVVRMDEDRIPKIVIENSFEGCTVGRGRPVKT